MTPTIEVVVLYNVGLGYHVSSPAQFASMIASKGDSVMVVGVLEAGQETFVGYYRSFEADELATKLRRMRKIKFSTVVVVN